MCRELLVRNAQIVSVAPLRGGGGGGVEPGLYWGREEGPGSFGGGGRDPGFIGERVSSLWNLIGASLILIIVCQVKY